MIDVVILAAGEGTRLRPITVTRPKPMIPIAGKPILEWNLKALKENGFKKVKIVVGYKREVIENYFGDEFSGIKIEYVTQKEQLGTAHAVKLLEDKVDDNFLVMNGDIIVSSDFLQDFLRKIEVNDPENAIALVKVKDPRDFGVVYTSGTKVVRIEEKPKTFASDLINAGIYIFSQTIFSAIKSIEKSKRFEYEITDAIGKLIERNVGVNGFRCEGVWIDVGKPWDLLDANETVMKEILSEKDFKIDKKAEIEDFTTLKGKVHIGKNTIVRSGAYIEGPCYIGDNCILGPNCYVRAFTSLVGENYVGNAVEIKNSIIMRKTKISHLSYIGDSIIGENCNFGAGTKVANLKLNESHVKVEIKNKLVSTGRRKFGCVMGDNVKTGINVSIMPGRAIYPNVYIDAGSVVRNTIYGEGY